MPKQQQLVYLSDEQFQTLVAQGSITVDGQTVEYSEDDIYVTPQEDAYIKPATGIPASDLADDAVPVKDVQVNGSSILQNGIANVPVANPNQIGVVKVLQGDHGLFAEANGLLRTYPAMSSDIKAGAHQYRQPAVQRQHESTFYGLAKAAGHDEKDSTEPLGTYTPEAKTAIRSMIGAADADELNNKANRDGYYSEMTVGNAEQLVSSKFVEDQEPYTLRASGGSADIGNRENLTAIVGGTLAWNQQVRDGASDNVTEFADIVTVDDAVADNAGVKVKIEPVQDLHGYDHPWPAGGGANKFNPSTWIQLGTNTNFYSVSGDDITVNALDESGIASRLLQLDAESTYSWRVFGNIATARIFGSNSSTVASGATGSFTVPADRNVAIKFTADSYPSTGRFVLVKGSIVPTDFTPYSNLCPISGWTGAKVTRTGKNLAPAEEIAIAASGTYNGISTQKTANGYTFNGVSTASGLKFFGGFPIYSNRTFEVLANKTYVISYMQTGGFHLQGNILDKNNKQIFAPRSSWIIPGDSTDATTGRNYAVFVPSANGRVAFIAYAMLTEGTEYIGSISDIQLELGSTATDYEPYSGQTYSISFPSEAGTVYGGELTVNKDGTGSLKVDRASVDMGTLTWDTAATDTAGKNRFVANIPGIKIGNANQVKLVCSEYNEISTTYGYGSLGIAPHGTVARVLVADYTRAEMTGEEFKSAMSGVQLVYELATPQTYTLTASQVTTLLGTNNVWSDAGQVSLTYTGTDEHLTLTDGRKYLTRINGVDSIVLGAGQAVTAVKGRDNVFDLTQMFGTAAVADYVYGQGAGYFRKWFPLMRYAYNPGELKSVEGLQSHDTVGFNLLEDDVISGEHVGYSVRMPDEKWQRLKVQLTRLKQLGQPLFYRVESNTTSTSGISIGSIKFRNDSENAMLPFTLLTNVSNDLANLDLEKADAAYIYGSNIVNNVVLSNACISLVNNGSRNGEYEPYEKHSYPLDSSLTLHGIPKAGANGIYWDGDQYKPDGTVERRYKLLTLTGNEQYNIFAGGEYIKSDACDAYINIADCSYPFASATPGYISDHNLKPMSNNAIWAAIGHPNTFCMNNTQLHLNISNDLIGVTDYTKETAQTALQKIKNHIKAEYDAGTPYVFILPLATPTTETAESYRELQQVDDWGTEEFATTGLIPVGHTTQYPANLRDKLQHLPDLASSNGIYIVKQTDSEMELMKLPDMPTANGNYRLKLNVASGSPTFSWEAVT